MPIDRTNYNALVDDDGSNTLGTPWLKNTVKIVLLDPIDAAIAALATAWTAVTYLAANFAGFSAGLVWTVDAGDVSLNRWVRIGNVLVWAVTIDTSSISGTAGSILQIAIPTGAGSFATIASRAAAVAPLGAVVAPVDGTHLGIFYPSGNWPATVNGTSVSFTWIGQVV